jgi:hypothetical protein
MAKPLIFRHGKSELSFQLDKLDRDKLYGYVDTEALDAASRACQLAILGGDGKTLVGRGGSALQYVDADGSYATRGALKPVSPEGQPLATVTSSFAAPIALDKRASVDDYLSHNVKSVYLLTPPMGAEDLLNELRAGAIYSFPFSYRGGLNPSVGFLLASSDGIPTLAVGQKARLEFVRLAEIADPDEETEVEEAEGDDEMDFGMM